MVQILRTGAPDFQELLRVILTADITSGTLFSFSGTHFWLQDSSGTQFAQNYFGHDAQDLRIWSYWFQSGSMKDYDSIWENKYLCYIWYEVYTETWSKNSISLQWSCPHSKHHLMRLEWHFHFCRHHYDLNSHSNLLALSGAFSSRGVWGFALLQIFFHILYTFHWHGRFCVYLALAGLENYLVSLNISQQCIDLSGG